MSSQMQNNTLADNKAQAIKRLESFVKSIRRKKQLAFVCQSFLLALSTFILISPIDLPSLFQYLLVSLVGVFSLALLLKSSNYRVISLENFIEHLNRHFKDYQESAQLILSHKGNLSQLQRIQSDHITNKVVEDCTNGRIAKVLPGWPWRGFIFPLLVLVVALAFSYLIIPNFPSDSLKHLQTELTELETAKNEAVKPHLINAKVKITPPSYTQLPTENIETLDLNITEGSKVEWEIQFNAGDSEIEHWYLVDSDENKTVLTPAGDNRYNLTLNINQTTFYRFAYSEPLSEDNALKTLPEVYSIAVNKDQLPKIKIVEPNLTLVEIPKSKQASFNIEAHISDDFGIGEVTILASVAKGSGEAVKFRDETFKFDTSSQESDKTLYFKEWSLGSLGMEPGDEVYFSIVAFDNKQPDAQQNKSSSVIVRWLDDEIIETALEGIQIRFVPEFFRSQRQIIIETEQLIADKKDLFPTVFKEKSVDLGFSQRDLKEKYGQYLGDEFGEGPAPETVEMHGLADGYHGGEDVAQGEATAGMASHLEHLYEKDNHDNHSGQEGHAHSHNAVSQSAGYNHEGGHSHEDGFGNSMVDPTDLSGASELIAQFAHNHGSAEIGPLSKRDPKSWMKRAVNVMWQAELHLMMHEPEKALPYEYEAYQYLKLARQAEKIYVKRLGFEPPPVKESNRLTGELDDILTYESSVEDRADATSDTVIFNNAFQVLSDPELNQKLSLSAREVLTQLRDRLLRLAENRPILISYAATLEKVLAADALILSDCDNCIADLKAKLWQLASRPVSLPKVPFRESELPTESKGSPNENNERTRNYIKAMEELLQQTNQKLSASLSAKTPSETAGAIND